MLQQVFDSAQLAVTDQVKSGLTFRAVQGRRKQFMAVSFDLNKIFYTYPFLVPDYFALITRAMIVLEGIAVTGDPEFDLFKVRKSSKNQFIEKKRKDCALNNILLLNYIRT